MRPSVLLKMGPKSQSHGWGVLSVHVLSFPITFPAQQAGSGCREARSWGCSEDHVTPQGERRE